MNTARIVILANAANTGLTALFHGIADVNSVEARSECQPSLPDGMNAARDGIAMHQTIQT